MRKTVLQNKLTLNSYSSNGKQTAKRTSDFIKFYAVLGLFVPWVPEVLFFFREERAVKTERRKINLWSRRL